MGFIIGDTSPDSGGKFIFTTVSRSVLRFTEPHTLYVSGAHFLGVKRPGLEADHLSPSIAEVKNPWSYTSIPFVAW
jgi:hypothetical protein